MKQIIPRMGWRQNTPRFIKEAKYGEWKKRFIFWYPVLTEQHTWIWLHTVWARPFEYPEWFSCGTGRSAVQYSQFKRAYWEI